MQPLPQPLPLNKVISDNKIFYGRNEKTINELIGNPYNFSISLKIPSFCIKGDFVIVYSSWNTHNKYNWEESIFTWTRNMEKKVIFFGDDLFTKNLIGAAFHQHVFAYKPKQILQYIRFTVNDSVVDEKFPIKLSQLGKDVTGVYIFPMESYDLLHAKIKAQPGDWKKGAQASIDSLVYNSINLTGFVNISQCVMPATYCTPWYDVFPTQRQLQGHDVKYASISDSTTRKEISFRII